MRKLTNSFKIFFTKHSLLMFKFGLVGVLTAVLYFGALFLLMNYLLWDYLISVSLAYLISTTYHFLANRHITNSASDGSSKLQLLRYMLLWIFNYISTIFIVTISVSLIELSVYIGVCLSVLFTVCFGYFLSHKWVFNFRVRG
jgi:putative flippase GtrA